MTDAQRAGILFAGASAILAPANTVVTASTQPSTAPQFLTPNSTAMVVATRTTDVSTRSGASDVAQKESEPQLTAVPTAPVETLVPSAPLTPVAPPTQPASETGVGSSDGAADTVFTQPQESSRPFHLPDCSTVLDDASTTEPASSAALLAFLFGGYLSSSRGLSEDERRPRVR